MVASNPLPRGLLQRRFKACFLCAVVTLIIYSIFFDLGTNFSETNGALVAFSLTMVAVFGSLSLSFWIAGCSYQAQSKGYSKWWGAAGLLTCVGAFLLFLLPNRWTDDSPITYQPGDYPRPNG